MLVTVSMVAKGNIGTDKVRDVGTGGVTGDRGNLAFRKISGHMFECKQSYPFIFGKLQIR